MNKVKLIVNRKEMTARFECEGDVWKWISKVKNRNSNMASRIMGYVLDNEVTTFAYEMYLDKYIKQYSEKVDLIVEI